MECVPGFDGGQPQHFDLEVYEGRHLVANVSSDTASFSVSGLAPGLVLRIMVFAANAKGRSEPSHLEGFTLKAAEKQTGESSATVLHSI